jgi:hypothetical protein
MSGPFSKGTTRFQRQYDAEVAARLRCPVIMPLLVEADLLRLPEAVQRYLRISGTLGQPRVRNFRARFHGRIRSGPKAHWMAFSGKQHSVYDPPARFFLMKASMFGLPFDVFHRFVGDSATMRVKLASLLTVVDAKGPEMDKAETVTLFNDMCIFAPATLIDPDIHWQVLDADRVAAEFTHGLHTIRAVLSFNERGELADFVSDDRALVSAGGDRFTKMRWSTPLADYRAFGAHRLMSRGEGIWHAPQGAYAYLQLALDAIDYNVCAKSDGRGHRAFADAVGIA